MSRASSSPVHAIYSDFSAMRMPVDWGGKAVENHHRQVLFHLVDVLNLC